MNMSTLKYKWLFYAISGLLLIGFGLSLFGEAAYLKHTTDQTWEWISLGTLSLIVFNSGICLFGQAIIYRVKMENL